MNLFDVYSLYDVVPVKASGARVWDDKGQEYLDLYGGHAVISIGHSHPDYVAAITDQLGRIGFYSNSVVNPLQEELARKLGEASGYEDYSLFLDNSGAESNENAMKLASFHTGRDRIVAFRKSFHGRTSGAVAVTDNPKIVSPFNSHHKVSFCELEDAAGVEAELMKGDVAGVIIEGIQGCGGINVPTASFMQTLAALCRKYGTVLILDEVQSGYGRTGRFFAHQWYGIRPDIITMGKGIANGFPCGGILISPEFKAVKGMLGTTFGGNYLAMAAAISVLDVIAKENLVENALKVGEHILANIPASDRIKEVRGKGLMIGIEFNESVAPLRKELLFEKHIFTGVAGSTMIRLLAPLCIGTEDADTFIKALKEVLS
ncbi:MAG: aminotransferase class III-fold pyridoxal phosphate-dependent enzyme [Bacteroidales bacterium]|uniref:aspartate aminotransferase family protein n=1 Tax=Candidatus Cryptobacteroides sp. TaxID=2952915 RepID=UPI002A823203|nr:aminotransferase class III-fold pyridoxal phosphate-dependent enzyme [Candidatus Cryptobacteroides sp.]MDD5914945.1 aminotransferase class III-fold pyridoxal phosphate-dependent enzyme [Bacteroidales bacterium]MDD7135093.1 aminotransferase class III-fold pyridoxal phosphate-dependent enzyme [Bacteroidales bacterium]MDY3878128.1 aminotransferase class III-fold pyridoxal phosphate-dependent enzyme [Candidatus Cryptobacteroides sp.]MDY5566145.1 aminotransferase class III-fold pyridoxal phosphat